MTSHDLHVSVLATAAGGLHPSTLPRPTDIGYSGAYGQRAGFISRCIVCFSTDRLCPVFIRVHTSP